MKSTLLLLLGTSSLILPRPCFALQKPEELACIGLLRSIVTTDRVTLWKEIISLYPSLSEETLRVKLANAKNPFLFLRSFIPVFFKRIEESSSIQTAFAPLMRYRGFGMGDAHPENFGALIDREGHSHFCINDPDDNGEIPLFIDLERFMTASALMEPQIDRNAIIDSYLHGLRDLQPRPWSKPVQKILKESEKAGRKISKEKDLNPSEDTLKRPAGSHGLSKETAAAVHDWINENFDHQYKIKDSYAWSRPDGGSAGYARIRLLLKDRSTDKWVHFELKEISDLAGTFPVSTLPYPAPAARMQQALAATLPGVLQGDFSVLRLEGRNYLGRFRWKGNVPIRLAAYADRPEARLAVISDEAYLLGQMHRRTAVDLKGYQEEISRTSKDALLELSDRLIASTRLDAQFIDP